MKVLFPVISAKANTIPPFYLLKFLHSLSKRSCSVTLPASEPQTPPTAHLSPDDLNNLLNKATQEKNIRHATQIHTQLIIQDYIFLPFLFNNLLNLYAKCGHLSQALTFFNAPMVQARRTLNLEHKNVVTWTSVITQLSHYHKPFKALTFFNDMRRTGVYPNHFTFSAVLPACADSLIIFHGHQIHCLIHKHGFESDLFVGSALLNMYAKSGDMMLAKKVFDEMPERNIVSWNSMIVGCLQNSLHNEAFGVFVEVLREGSLVPDQVSISSVLSACANMGAGLNGGRQVHGVVVKHRLVSLAYVRNSLMDMYFKCGCFDDGFKLCGALEDRDVVTWNIMIMGCVENDNFEEACNHFWVMRREGVSPDEASFSSVLHAAACIAALDQGTLIHSQMVKAGFDRNTCVASSLITLYAKCGSLADAQRVFNECEENNVVSWTAIISAYQQHGCASQVITLFEDMLRKGIKPDYITFVCLLSACSHSGRIDEGFSYFHSMTQRHDMKPGHEHYACMVDMLSRGGRLQEAKKFVETMPIQADASIWGALLGACRNYGNLEMGRVVAEKLFKIEPDNPGNYVLLSDMYSRRGKLEEADEIRRLMGVNRVKKEPGCSWLDIKNTTYVFKVHDRSHSRTHEIYKMLEKMEEMVKQKGYDGETGRKDGVDGHKSSWYHSERLALAFGLLTVPLGAPIRIKKNLRTCNDCHTVMKFASEIFNREIIVRDINRFHRFTNGLCSCGDYW
ncbi:unnamed protein product [Coffea canephora]|uniref:DYW domain-containing protein n=1 Tax=Coffea canephora TaxID=49390 RepID=A0A068V3Q9_COFCA|nr:unnamed protein product [Coffea canephora]